MPELPPAKNPEIIGKLADYSSETWDKLREKGAFYSTQNILREIYPDDEYVGMGGEAIIIGHPENEELVVGYHIDEKTMTGNYDHIKMYHMQKVLHTLFPHNFPRLRAVWKKDIPITYRERIEKAENPLTIDYPMQDALKAFKQWGFTIALDYGSPNNFIIGKDGGEHYVDMVMKNLPPVGFAAPYATEEYFSMGLMKDGKLKPDVRARLSEREAREVLASLQRLKELSLIESFHIAVSDPEKHLADFDPTNSNQVKSTIEKVGIDPNNKKALTRIRKAVALMDTKHPEVKEKTLQNIDNILREHD